MLSSGTTFHSILNLPFTFSSIEPSSVLYFTLYSHTFLFSNDIFHPSRPPHSPSLLSSLITPFSLHVLSISPFTFALLIPLYTLSSFPAQLSLLITSSTLSSFPRPCLYSFHLTLSSQHQRSHTQ